MKTIYLSATELKRNTAEILNSVAYAGDVAVVERFGEPVARIIPIKSERKKDRREVLNKYYGIIPDFPDVTKFRVSRKKAVNFE